MSELTDRLDIIQAQLDAATPGPWQVDGMDSGHSRYEMDLWITAGDSGDVVCDMDGLNRSRNECVAKDDGRSDVEFISAAPENTRYLLDLARKQQAALEAVSKLAAKFEATPEHRSVAARIREALEATP